MRSEKQAENPVETETDRVCECPPSTHSVAVRYRIAIQDRLSDTCLITS